MNRNELKLDVALNIVGILTGINEQVRDMLGTDKYNIHKFINMVREDDVTSTDLILLNEKLKGELKEVLAEKRAVKKEEPSFEEMLKELFESLKSLDEEDDEETEDDDCDCSSCPVSDICSDYEEETLEEDDDAERAKAFADKVKAMAEEEGFIITEIGIGKLV